MKTWIVGAALLSIAVSPARGAEAPPDTPVERGVRLYEAGRYDAAIGILEAAVSRDSTDGRAPYYAGRAHFDKGNYPEAAEWLELAVERVPGNAEYHKWLGRAYGQWASDANFFRKMNLRTPGPTAGWGRSTCKWGRRTRRAGSSRRPSS